MKTNKPYLICLAAAVVVLAAARRVPAQYTGPYTDSMGGSFNNPISAQMSTMLWNRIFYPKASGNSSTRTSSSSANTPAPQSAPRTQSATPNRVDESALRFRPTGTHIATPGLANQLGNTPAEREQYLKLMNAVVDGFDQKVREAGLQNDIAIALSYFLAENARIYHGLPELSDQQFVNLRNTIADALLSTGALGSVTDQQKQKFYEGLVAYTGLTQYIYEEASKAGNKEMMQTAQKLAGQNLQTVTKMSPDDINFGPNGLSAESGSAPASQTSPAPASGDAIDIYQLRSDYSENGVRADQMYKGKRFVFTGTVVEVSDVYYKTTGHDDVGRPIYTNIGANLNVTNTGGGTVIGWDVHCFFKDNNQLAQLRARQKVTFEATVQGRENGTNTLILTDAVLR
jgi:hypothetical protein